MTTQQSPEAGYPGYTGPTVTIQSRTDTINRAIEYIEQHGAGSDMVACTLYYTDIHQHLKDDPAELVAKLRAASESGNTFGAWKGAQQICQAAGLPY